jgi:Na+/phosphate symporter
MLFVVNFIFDAEVDVLNKGQNQIRVLLFIGVMCLFAGFLINATSPDRVFIGSTVMGIGALLFSLALVPAIKLTIKLKQKHKTMNE